MAANPCCDEPPADLHRLELARSQVVDEATAQALAEILQALADPTRVRIISALAAQELCVGELAALLGLSISAISHQLRLLRRLRVVKSRRQGQHIFYTLDDEHVALLYRCGLEHVRHG
jgi:DNA-binding transcriptional ArsR family regulator